MLRTDRLPAILAFLKVLLHLCTAQTLGFHRDELLYMALGRHPDWGYWSNPPLIGWMSWLVQHTLGADLLTIRLLPALGGGLFVWLVLRMVQEMGGGERALWITAAGLFGSVAWLRTFSMLQPVPMDIIFWTFTVYALLRWINSGRWYWWWAAGAGIGLGMLNKYMLVFLGAGILLSLLLTSRRSVLCTPGPWAAAGVGLLLTLPNIGWQWQHGFPVFAHMQELRSTQLQHVEPVQFLFDQVMFHGPAILLWMAGLLWLLWAKAAHPYRLLGWLYVVVIVLFLALSGKSYYTLGAYPVLFAAGGVYWEKLLQQRWQLVVLATALLLLPLPLLPYGLPVMKLERLARYYRTVPVEGALRWEDGHVHSLPQDFADMLGWPELGALVNKALEEVPEHDACMIYAENYGQAGAAEYYSGRNVVSFSDSYRLWAPHTLSANTNTLIYINDELGQDVQNLFKDIRIIGSIEDPLAREFGTTVWLCTEPRASFPDFWRNRVKRVYGVRTMIQ